MHDILFRRNVFFVFLFLFITFFLVMLSLCATANYVYPPKTYFGYSYAENDWLTWEYYKYGPNYFMHTGFDYDGDDEKWRGWTEWDISSIPDDAEIFDVGVQFEVTGKPTECNGQWADVDICHMTNRPSTTGGDVIENEGAGGLAQILWNDAGDGTVYVDMYTMNSNGFYPSSSIYLDLGAAADADLELKLASNWFAVGVADNDDGYDEGIVFRVTSFRVEYSSYPDVSGTDILSYPSALYPGMECVVVAEYHDIDGYDDIQYCWLRIDNDAMSPVEEYLDLRWQDGGITYVDPTDSEYVSINSVSESSSGTTTTLTWNFVLDWDWTEDTGVDFGVMVEDDHGLTDGWVLSETNIVYENDVFLHDLTVFCASDWNGGDVEDGDWIGGDDAVTVSGHFYYEGSTVAPPSGEIVADIYADGVYTGVSDLCDSNGYFDAVFTSASNTDLDYLIDVVASSIPTGGGEAASADDGKSARIDATAPTAPNPDDGVEGWSNDNTPIFTWSASDYESGIHGYYWKVDDGDENWTDISSVTLPEQTDGDHTFYVRAEDNVGNSGDYGQHTFFIDTLPPMTTCSLEGDMQGDVYIGYVIVTLDAVDTLSGVQYITYKIDDGSWEVYSESFIVSDSGYHTVFFYAVDNADNVEGEKECSFSIGYPPESPEISGTSTGEAGTEYTYTFMSTHPDGDDVYFYIEWGDGSFEDWIGPYGSGEQIDVSHTWSEQGTYTIKAKAKNEFDLESEWGSLEVTMPVNQPVYKYSFLEWIFERFPHAFPLLRYILGWSSR